MGRRIVLAVLGLIAVLALAFLQDVLERHQAAGQKSDAQPVDVGALLGRHLLVGAADVLRFKHEARDHEQGQNAHRQVDEEDPRPAIVVDDIAAEFAGRLGVAKLDGRYRRTCL